MYQSEFRAFFRIRIYIQKFKLKKILMNQHLIENFVYLQNSIASGVTGRCSGVG